MSIEKTSLHLSLKTKWLVMTLAGFKTEDYRELTPYWHAALCLYDGQQRTQKFWEYAIEFDISKKSFKPIDQNIMTLGFPKATDTKKILILEHKGIEIRMGNPEWGAEPGKFYFVIKHGKIITHPLQRA